MKKFSEEKQFDLPTLEQELLKRWNEEGLFARSVAERRGAPTFTFYEGPPTANGRPGIHHVMSRTIKDIFCRYKTMKGFRVERKGGWDTHGLPVEIEVEKTLGLEGRHQVESYGIERYNAACRESVLRYKAQWDELTTRMGYWVDLDRPYVTFHNAYIESVWWLLKQIYEKGLLYKGYKIQWYSPGSATVLSSHEVSLGYREVQDPSVYVRFKQRDAEDTYFLAWTTTPWTLISNTGLAVGPDVEYVTFRQTAPDRPAERIVVARARASVLSESYVEESSYSGRELVGRRYEPLFPYFEGEAGAERAWRVVPAEFVSTDDGTGIVHLAPAFGAEDFEAGRRHGLPLVNPVTPDGVFDARAELVAGLWFKEADKVIVRHLKERGRLFRQETYLHNYPHDWRKGTPLMSYPVESWFIRTTAVKDRLIALNAQINWQPKQIGEGRFGEWLQNNVDWALSRRRYWGTPLPIWQSDAPGSTHIEVIGSIAELRALCGDQMPPDASLDLHRPFVDRFTWPAPDGGTMRRVPDLIDVWFDSGAMPFAQWHYPFENQEQFAENFPADFIAEGVDQTRGWFYTLHAIATVVMDNYAFKNVVVNGLLLDENGEKMSKTRGNAVDPYAFIAKHGADPVRWYMMSNSPPWEDLKFSERGLIDVQRRFLGTLQNVYAFFSTYANVDGFRYAEPRIPVLERAELDRWVMSQLNSTTAAVEAAYAEYNPTRAARAIEAFVESLSNWYLRRSRRRFWSAKGGDTGDERDKLTAYQTVYECLEAVALLMSPIAPFFGDWLFRALNEVTGRSPHPSAHLARMPEVEDAALDAALEHRMALARTVSSIVLALRNTCGINVRQPLPRIMVVTGPSAREADLEPVRAIVLDEVNVKRIEYVAGSSGVVRRSAKANFKTLGRRLGADMKAAAARIRDLAEEEISRFLEEGRISLDISGRLIGFEREDIEIVSEGIDGWQVEQQDGVTVALDTAVTDELLAEGLARETINRIQNMRKSASFDVTDRIQVHFQASERLAHAIVRHAAWIRNETLAASLEESPCPSGALVETFSIGNETLTLAVERIP